jgi:hypothetical protein
MTAIFDQIDALPAWIVIVALAVLITLLSCVFIHKQKSPAPVGAEDGANGKTQPDCTTKEGAVQ